MITVKCYVYIEICIYIFLFFSIDPTIPKLNFHVSIPHLRLEGSFDVDGKIIMISFRGHGDMIADVCKILDINISDLIILEYLEVVIFFLL